MTNVIDMKSRLVYPSTPSSYQLHDPVVLVRGRGSEQVLYCGVIVGRTLCPPTEWVRGQVVRGEYQYDVRAGRTTFRNLPGSELSDVPWQRQDCGAA